MAQEAQDARLYVMSNRKSEFEENQAELQFTLPKGSYATVVLREYMKSVDDIMSQSIDLAEE